MEVLNSPKPDFHSKMNTESPTSPARKLPMIPGRVKDGTCAPAFPFEKMAVSGSGVLSPKLPTSPFVPPNSTITNYQKLPLVLPDLPAAPSPRRIRKGGPGPITQFVLEGEKLRSMMAAQAAQRAQSMEDSEYDINPEPVPFQPRNFMSSTVFKKYPGAKRYHEMFGSAEWNKRGIIVHTDRYRWDSLQTPDGTLNQRERLQIELEYLDRLRGIKRKRDVIPHRTKLDLFMGGKKIEFEERFDLAHEIQKLKSLILPEGAKDLYHGKGFKLPPQHSSLRPKRTYFDGDSDDGLTSSAPAALLARLPSQFAVDPDIRQMQKQPPYQTEKSRRRQKQYPLQNITKAHLIGPRSTSPVILSKEKRTVQSLQARLGSNPKGTGISRSKTIAGTGSKSDLLRNSTSYVDTQRDPVAPPTSADPEAQKDFKELVQGQSLDSFRQESDLVLPKPNVESEKNEEENQKTPRNIPTPNPLKVADLKAVMREEDMDALRSTFQKLDTDMDGHLKYNQLKSQIPQVSVQQEKFIKQVYDITSSSTFFGVEEFMTMSLLTSTVAGLKGPPGDAYKQLDFNLLQKQIVQYVSMFQSVDRGQRGKISLASLQEVLSIVLKKNLLSDKHIWDKIVHELNNIKDSEMKINKLDYLAFIPYFISFSKK